MLPLRSKGGAGKETKGGTKMDVVKKKGKKEPRKDGRKEEGLARGRGNEHRNIFGGRMELFRGCRNLAVQLLSSRH